MSLFDYVRSEYSLPQASERIQHLRFQTKTFDDAYMEQYLISADGRLMREGYDLRIEKDGTSVFGSVWHHDNKRWEFYAYCGELRFYDWTDAQSNITYLAFFMHGQLKEIHCLEALGDYAVTAVPVISTSTDA